MQGRPALDPVWRAAVGQQARMVPSAIPWCRRAAGSLSGTLAGVGSLGVIQGLIDQVGDLGSSHQPVVSGAAPVVVTRTRRIRERRLE